MTDDLSNCNYFKAGWDFRDGQRLYWLPKNASWLDQVEIVFSKVQRDVLTPNDFANTQLLEQDLLAYFEDLNQKPKPIQWSFTKAKLIAKFGAT